MESSSSCTPGNSRTPRRTEGLSQRRFFRQTVEWWISYRGLVRVARHPYCSDGDGEVRTFGTTGLSAVGTAWCHEYSHYSLGPRCRGAPDRHGVGVADTAWVGERRNRSVVADLSEPLPLEASSLDGITCSLALHYLEDWSVPLASFADALVPGDWVVVSLDHPFGLPLPG